MLSEYIIDETSIKVGSDYIWLGVAMEPKKANSRTFLDNISIERNMLFAEKFVSSLVKIHGKHSVSTNGGTWYHQACRFLKLDHHVHSSLEKSLIERKIQYIKDRTESFDDYFPC
jgi:putative transposase